MTERQYYKLKRHEILLDQSELYAKCVEIALDRSLWPPSLFDKDISSLSSRPRMLVLSGFMLLAKPFSVGFPLMPPWLASKGAARKVRKAFRKIAGPPRLRNMGGVAFGIEFEDEHVIVSTCTIFGSVSLFPYDKLESNEYMSHPRFGGRAYA